MTKKKKPPIDLDAVIIEAVEKLPYGLAIHDDDYSLVMGNEIARSLFSSTFAQIDRGATFVESIKVDAEATIPGLTDEQYQDIAEMTAERLKSGKPVDLNTEDGRIMQVMHRPLNEGRHVAIGVDITELRQRQKELVKARAQAESANELKTAFLANISHEIRTPLNGILGMAQVLESGDLSSEQKDQIGSILDSGKTLMTLLNDILDLSKIEADRLEIARVDDDLRVVLQRAHRLWKPQAELKDIELTLDVGDTIPERLRFDPVRVRQCIDNLVSNGIKFTDQGRVDISASAEKALGGHYEVSIRIKDMGIGMTKKTVKNLFTPFTQADKSTTRRFGGTGLGLSITRKLAKLMDGDVTVESVLGEGSTFTLHFQASQVNRIHNTEPQNNDQQSKPENKVLWGEGLKILLVDDHPVNRQVARLFLDPYRVVVTEACNGSEALELLRSDTFDLVLLDMHMPVMDGPETFRNIRMSKEPWSEIPIIALTADAQTGARERFISDGMNGYVSKPMDQRELVSEINRTLNGDDESTQDGSAQKGIAT